MKHDQQHLEFLLSQYVDGTLDPANRKLVEQRLAMDPQARKLLKEQQEAQELLDEWGGRLPMIDWNDFDQRLAKRLDEEQVAVAPATSWQRWARPMAAAAALLVAAGIGYAWHAWTSTSTAMLANGNPSKVETLSPTRTVEIVDRPIAGGAVRVVEFPEAKGDPKSHPAAVAIEGREPTLEPRTDGVAGAIGGVRTGSVTADLPATQPGSDALH